MAVSRRVRFEVFRRDNFTCRYCGATAPEVTVTIDHVTPVALGGSDEPNNLVTACQDCNAGKSSIAPDQAMVDDVDATALLFSKAMDRAIEHRRREVAKMAVVTEWFRTEVWRDGGYMPPDWAVSIERFYAAGVQPEMLVKFAQIAVDRADPWRYFCGCCWTEMANLQETARRLIEDGQV